MCFSLMVISDWQHAYVTLSTKSRTNSDKKKASFIIFFSSWTWTSRLATAIGVLSVSKKQAIEPIEFQYCSLFLFGCPLPLGIIRHHPTLSSAAHSASQYFWPSLKNRDNLVWHCFWLPCLPYTSPSSPMMEASKNIVSKLSVCKWDWKAENPQNLQALCCLFGWDVA